MRGILVAAAAAAVGRMLGSAGQAINQEIINGNVAAAGSIGLDAVALSRAVRRPGRRLAATSSTQCVPAGFSLDHWHTQWKRDAIASVRTGKTVLFREPVNIPSRVYTHVNRGKVYDRRGKR